MTQLQLNGAATLVVGAGIMGAGIAQVAAQSGHAACKARQRPGKASSAAALWKDLR